MKGAASLKTGVFFGDLAATSDVRAAGLAFLHLFDGWLIQGYVPGLFLGEPIRREADVEGMRA